MSVVLVDVTRGKIVESRHRGHIAVADSEGRLIAYAGDPNTVTYMRSAAKPLQALNVIFSGAADKFRFAPQELSIMCASHYGEDIHRETIYGILEKLGLTVGDLLCGTPLSINPRHMRKQLAQQVPIDESCSDCSGKHCGFLAVCKHKGYPTNDYHKAGHPMQQEISAILSTMCGVPVSSNGIDGCGVPVHSMPLVNMAMAYARLSNPEMLDAPYQVACNRIYSAMNAAPEMLAGTGGFCTEFLKATNGRFCGKVGAEAVYCIGVKDKNIGIAVKIEDGNPRALYPAVMSVLKQLDLLSEEESAALSHFSSINNENALGNCVGKIAPVFELLPAEQVQERCKNRNNSVLD